MLSLPNMVLKKPADHNFVPGDDRNSHDQSDSSSKRGHGMIMKKKIKMKRSNSSKSMEKLIDGAAAAWEDFQGPQMCSKSPNYMKPTSSSVARKEQLQVTTHDLAFQTIKKENSRSLKKSPSSSVSSSPRYYEKRISRKASIRLRRPSAAKSISTSLSPEKAIYRSTCSSALKQSRFTKVTPIHPGTSEAEKTCANHVCPFHYCSINGENHEHSSSLKHFPSLKDRPKKTRMSRKLKKQSSFRRRSFRKGKEVDVRESDTEGTSMDVLIENHSESYEVIHIQIGKEKISRILRTLSSKEDYSDGSEEEGEELEEVMILNQDPEAYTLTLGVEYDLNQGSEIFYEAAVADSDFLKLETEENLTSTLSEYYTELGVKCCGLEVYESIKANLEDCHDTFIIDESDQSEDCGYFSDGSVLVFNKIEGKEKGNIRNDHSDASQNSLTSVKEEQSSRQGCNIEFEAGSLEDYKDDSSDGVEIQDIKVQQNSIYSASDNHDNAIQNITTEFRKDHLLVAEEVGYGLVLAEDDVSLHQPVSQIVKKPSYVNDHQIQIVPVTNEVYVEASNLYDNESQYVLLEVLEGEGSTEMKNIESLTLTYENVPPNSNETIQVLAGFHVGASDVPDHPDLNEIGFVLDKEGSSQAMEVTEKWVIVEKIANAGTNEDKNLIIRCNAEASAMPAYTTARTVIASECKTIVASSAIVEERFPFTRNEEREIKVSCNFKAPNWPYHPVHSSATNLQEQPSSSKAKEMEHMLMQIQDSFPRGSNRYVQEPFVKKLQQLKCYCHWEDINAKGTLIEPHNITECDDSTKDADLQKSDKVRLDNGNDGQMSPQCKAESNNCNEPFNFVIDLEDYDIRAGLKSSAKNTIYPENNGKADGKSENDEFAMEKEAHQLLCGVYDIEQDNPQRNYVQSNPQIDVERCNDAIEDSDIILKLNDCTFNTESDESNYENKELEEAEQDYYGRYNLRQFILQINGKTENLIYISYDAANSKITLSRINSNQKAKYYLKKRKKSQADDLAKVINWHAPNFVSLNSDPDAGKVNLRHIIAYERKNAKEWMMDYALKRLVHQFAATRERNVPLLVEAFDALLHHQLI